MVPQHGDAGDVSSAEIFYQPNLLPPPPPPQQQQHATTEAAAATAADTNRDVLRDVKLVLINPPYIPDAGLGHLTKHTFAASEEDESEDEGECEGRDDADIDGDGEDEGVMECVSISATEEEEAAVKSTTLSLSPPVHNNNNNNNNSSEVSTCRLEAVPVVNVDAQADVAKSDSSSLLAYGAGGHCGEQVTRRAFAAFNLRPVMESSQSCTHIGGEGTDRAVAATIAGDIAANDDAVTVHQSLLLICLVGNLVNPSDYPAKINRLPTRIMF